jgi:hypothetical protein
VDTVLFPTVVIQTGNYPALSGLEETIAPIYPGLQLPSARAVKSCSFRASEITFFYYPKGVTSTAGPGFLPDTANKLNQQTNQLNTQ